MHDLIEGGGIYASPALRQTRIVSFFRPIFSKRSDIPAKSYSCAIKLRNQDHQQRAAAAFPLIRFDLTAKAAAAEVSGTFPTWIDLTNDKDGDDDDDDNGEQRPQQEMSSEVDGCPSSKSGLPLLPPPCPVLQTNRSRDSDPPSESDPPRMIMTQLVVSSDMLSTDLRRNLKGGRASRLLTLLERISVLLPDNRTAESVTCYISKICKSSSDMHVVAMATTQQGLILGLEALSRASSGTKPASSSASRREDLEAMPAGRKRRRAAAGFVPHDENHLHATVWGGGGDPLATVSSESQTALSLVARGKKAGYFEIDRDGGIVGWFSESELERRLETASNDNLICVEAVAPHPAAAPPGHGVAFKALAARDMPSGLVLADYSCAASVFLAQEEGEDDDSTACLRDFEYAQKLYSECTDETFEFVVSGNPLTNLATRINDSRNLLPGSGGGDGDGGGTNCQFVSYLHVPSSNSESSSSRSGGGRKPRVVVAVCLTRDVRAGEELLASYSSCGGTFWEVMDTNASDRLKMKRALLKRFRGFMDAGKQPSMR